MRRRAAARTLAARQTARPPTLLPIADGNADLARQRIAERIDILRQVIFFRDGTRHFARAFRLHVKSPMM
jgi:hypothetical protein